MLARTVAPCAPLAWCALDAVTNILDVCGVALAPAYAVLGVRSAWESEFKPVAMHLRRRLAAALDAEQAASVARDADHGSSMVPL